MISKDPKFWYERGKQEGLKCNRDIFDLKETIRAGLDYIALQYPHAGNMDHLAIVEKLNEERLSAEPDYNKFPELKGLKECYRERQRGFIDSAKCTRKEMTFFYNSGWYISRRMATRYVGKCCSAPPGNCTSVYIKNSQEGPLLGSNCDIGYVDKKMFIPRMPEERKFISKGVSAALLCDDEPREIFPADPFELMSDELKADVNKAVEFLRRYNEFWGPGNTVLIDTNMNSVAVEKSNCHMGVRYPRNNSSCVTACCYLIPEMRELKLERDRLSLKARGWTEDSGDWAFWRGCEKRYERLLKLTDEETQRGATLWGMTKIVTDHAVPFPDRICVAGEIGHRDLPCGNWTILSFSAVMTGENRRLLFYRVENKQPVYNTLPYLVLGDGVKMKHEWRKGTRPIPEDEEQIGEAY